MEETSQNLDGWDIKREPSLALQELERWRSTRQRLVDKMRAFGWNKAETSRRSGVPAGTLGPWCDGTYNGQFKNITDRVEKFLDSVEELNEVAARIPTAPAYVATPTSQQVIDALLYAQTMPEISVITLASGMGKTHATGHYIGGHPHAYSMTMRPMTNTVIRMMHQLAETLDLQRADVARTRIEKAIGERLKRNGKNTLLIVDEAQHLQDEAVNQLRYFHDVYGVGIALVGNDELYGRFGSTSSNRPAYAQLKSRFGYKLRINAPQAGDIELMLDAWELTEPACRRYMMAVGRRPGALRNVTKTLQLAGMFAAGQGRPVTLDDLKLAVVNRDLEV